MLKMKDLLSPALAVSLASLQPALGLPPKISSLKPGEQLTVEMTLYGYVISRSGYVFTSDRVNISSNGKALGALSLTSEDRTRVDEFLDCVRRGDRKRPDDEGYVFSISYLQENWTFEISEPQESSKPTISLHELKKRLEDQEKAKIIEDPADAYLKAYLMAGNAGKTDDRRESSRLIKEALALFEEIKKQFPEWKKEMVETRIAETRKMLEKPTGAGN